MNRVSSSLVIGLGPTGLKVAALLLRAWEQGLGAVFAPPNLIGVGFEEPPQGFPRGQYVKLSIQPDEALERLAHRPQPHIQMWLDAPSLRRSWRDYVQLPRPLERLAWFQDMALGEQSQLYRVWKRQFEAMPRRATVFIVADLGQAAGSSLIMDSVYLARQFSDHGISILGYTVLPSASEEVECHVRAFAALRELSRFLTTPDTTFGYPFYYRPAALAANVGAVWYGSLDEKPFDAWYCFDGSKTISAEIAEIIGVYLSDEGAEIERQRMVNLAEPQSRLSKATPIVGTARARSVALPIQAIQQHWSLELAQKPIKVDRRFLDEEHATRQARDFWNRFSSNSLENSVIGQSSPKWERWFADRNVELSRRIDNLDQFLFPDPNLVPDSQSECSLRLRRNDFLFEPKSPNSEKISRTEATLKSLGAIEGKVSLLPQDNAYLMLIGRACDAHRVMFSQALRQTLGVLLTPSQNLAGSSGILLAIRVINKLVENVAAAAQLFSLLPSAESNRLKREYDSLRELKTQVIGLSQTGSLLGRVRTQGSLHSAFSDYQEAVASYLDGARLVVLSSESKGLLESFSEMLSIVKAQLATWQDLFAAVDARYEQILNRTEIGDAPPTVRILPPTYTHPWVENQKRRYLERHQVMIEADFETVSWDVQEDLTLLPSIQQKALPADSLQNVDLLLRQYGETVFQAAPQECTLSLLLEECGSEFTPARLVDDLRMAEQPMLEQIVTDDSQRAALGCILLPSNSGPAVQQIAAQLRRVHYAVETSEDFIRSLPNSELHRVTYLFLVECLRLPQEVAAYSRLQSAYLGAPNQLRLIQHIFGPEQVAVRYEAAHPQSVPLLPVVIGVLHDPHAFYAYWLAWALGLIQKQIVEHSKAPGSHYVLAIPGESATWQLTTTNLDVPLLEAVANFTHHVAVYNHNTRQSPVDKEYLNAAIEGQFRHKIHELIEAGALLSTGDSQLQTFLDRAAKMPTDLRAFIEEDVARCLLLPKFGQAAQQAAPSPQIDLLDYQLYALADFMFEEQEQQYRDHATQVIITYFGI